MVDTDTFLTTLYVMVDDFCKTYLPPDAESQRQQQSQKHQYHAGTRPSRPGPAPSLCRSEVVCLALFSQFALFASEHDFYRYASRHLRPAFPTLPHRTQLNRLIRRHYSAIAQFAVHLAHLMQTQEPHNYLYEALDTSAVPVRAVKRRGVGWLPEFTNIGYSGRIGWYCGFHLLTSVTQVGVITGWGFGMASSKDQPLAESFFSARALPEGVKLRAMCSVGCCLQSTVRGRYRLRRSSQSQTVEGMVRSRSDMPAPPLHSLSAVGEGDASLAVERTADSGECV
jgi:hypothetical protein